MKNARKGKNARPQPRQLMVRIKFTGDLNYEFLVDLTNDNPLPPEKTSDQEDPDRDEFSEPRKTRTVKLRNLTRRRCISCETVLSDCTW